MSKQLAIPTTQRAYTLRLGGDGHTQAWQQFLWNTHQAVNHGTKVFGDWLLTLRGGLCHKLADEPPLTDAAIDKKWTAMKKAAKEHQKAGEAAVAPSRSDAQSAANHERAERIREKRVLLALSWLSVESRNGAPSRCLVSQSADGKWNTIDALDEILRGRGLAKAQVQGWIEDCSPSLTAAVRDDAVWCNRSHAFDEAARTIGKSLTRDEVWDCLERFFGSRDTYLASMAGEKTDEEESAANIAGEKAKDLVQKAGQWLSSRFGTGKGADFGRMAGAYKKISTWATKAPAGHEGKATLAQLAKSLTDLEPSTNDLDGILGLISGPGYKSATRNLLNKIHAMPSVAQTDLDALRTSAEDDAVKCGTNVSAKGQRPYASLVLKEAESACGFTYLQVGGPARHSEFAVMLDHAARRVSLAHSWIKRAEAQRSRFEADAARIHDVPDPIKKWLDAFCRQRSLDTGAVELYRIRRRAVDGWKEVVHAWSNATCRTKKDRIDAARHLQANLPEDGKFGDIQLFEALAGDDAVCVWTVNDKPAPQPLLDYVAATDALAKQRRFKVPAYRHPDPLLHPIFCDFGNSRWDISFAAHEAAGNLEKTESQVRTKQTKLQDAEAANQKAKTPERQAMAAQQLHDASIQLTEARKELDRLNDHHALTMKLWTGSDVEEVPLSWHSKRLMKDLALRDAASSGKKKGIGVSRADRLGLAAGDAPADGAIHVLGLFEQKDWNGRLQAPRKQLNAIAAIRDDSKLPTAVKTAKMDRLVARIKWLVTFSAKLQPQGPWIDFAKVSGLSVDPQYWPHSTENKSRQGQAKLILCRLPGLRLLSVDLGHRCAAACAVWETLASKQVLAACRAIGQEPPSEATIYLHLKGDDGKKTIYRRVGPNELPDGKLHPAPWARFDRQFLIKLQGEQNPARAASLEELAAVERIEDQLGRVSFPQQSRHVDQLMSRAVRVVRLALARHGQRARIAHNLVATTKTVPGGKPQLLDNAARIEVLAEALATWHSLFSSRGWTDNWAKEQWQASIQPLLGGATIPDSTDDGGSFQARKKQQEELRQKLLPVAKALAGSGSTELSLRWKSHWQQDDQNWPKILRWLRDWLMPRHLRKQFIDQSGRSVREAQSAKIGGARHVGGLSLDRIVTLKSLYQVQKAFHMRPEPDDLRRNIPDKGDDALTSFGQGILDTIERMRVNRVKQLASRIVEAALGVGIEQHNGGKKDLRRPRQRIDDARFAPCHAVVIENLTNYRPEETQTRRENRQLMEWSSSKVKKYLADACQLYGLHLREVGASYTSQQDSRTGAPGVRCKDVPVAEFVKQGGYLWKRIQDACEKQETDEHRYLVELYKRWNEAEKTWLAHDGVKWQMGDGGKWLSREGQTLPPKCNIRPHPVRIPQRGGEIFVSANHASPAANGLQADLNAAANIGLRALLDPDWNGKWWYVPCDPKTLKPVKDKIKGGVADIDGPLSLISTGDSGGQKKTHAKGAYDTKVHIINLWRDCSADGLTQGKWMAHAEYKKDVQRRVVGVLRTLLGQEEPTPF